MPFHKIFSKKPNHVKTEPKQLSKIIVDIHEKNSLVPSELSKLGVKFEFAPLKVADYLISDTAIERKTINDLKASIISKRMLFQLAEIAQYPKFLLIIEGTANQNIYEGILHENALRGFILSAILIHKVPVIFTQNEKDTSKYLAILARKSEKAEISLRQKIPLSPIEQKQFILEGFPGIGPKTAKALLKKFSSLKDIFNADDAQLKDILKSKTEGFTRLLIDSNRTA
jgi:Fanconi anemia group M protein